VGFSFKKRQADKVAGLMNSPEVEAFATEKNPGKEDVRRYGTGSEEGNAPKEF